MSGLRRTKIAVERVSAIMRELFNGITVPSCGERASGLSLVTGALKRAHEKHPELFVVDVRQISSDGHQYTQKALACVGAILEEWFVRYGDIPYYPKAERPLEPEPGKLPFWSCPLKYPTRDVNGAPDLSALTDLEARQFLFAEKIRQIAVELLRAEQWIY